MRQRTICTSKINTLILWRKLTNCGDTEGGGNAPQSYHWAQEQLRAKSVSPPLKDLQSMKANLE